jgi:hypothetical protein
MAWHALDTPAMTISTDRKLRIAMLGCGRMGQQHALNVCSSHSSE